MEGLPALFDHIATPSFQFATGSKFVSITHPAEAERTLPPGRLTPVAQRVLAWLVVDRSGGAGTYVTDPGARHSSGEFRLAPSRQPRPFGRQVLQPLGVAEEVRPQRRHGAGGLCPRSRIGVPS
jgi:hypothetical protein